MGELALEGNARACDVVLGKRCFSEKCRTHICILTVAFLTGDSCFLLAFTQRDFIANEAYQISVSSRCRVELVSHLLMLDFLGGHLVSATLLLPQACLGY